MNKKIKDLYHLPSVVLFILGILDIIRGFMHTFNIHWAATNIAKLDLSFATQDQLFLLATFGISNYFTGFLFVIISKKAKKLSPYVIILIPLTYLLGIVAINFVSIQKTSEFNGQYFMLSYFGVCVITFLIFAYKKYSKKSN